MRHSYNEKISVPPHAAQTVNGVCTPATNSTFFLFTTHTHRFATSADVNYPSGGQTTNLVHTMNWAHPVSQVFSTKAATSAKDAVRVRRYYELKTTHIPRLWYC